MPTLHPGKVFVARAGRAELTTTILTEAQVHELVERMLRISGRRLDLSSPFVDASLATGERVHVVIPDITRRSWAVNIRKYIARATRVSDLVALGSLTTRAAAFLDAAVVSGMNILVSGATQAGKTTMVNALAGAIPPHERIITCEEVFGLWLANRDGVAVQCWPPLFYRARADVAPAVRVPDPLFSSGYCDPQCCSARCGFAVRHSVQANTLRDYLD